MNRKSEGKIFLTGTCGYELTGLCSLLSAQGYDVYPVPPADSGTPDTPDLVIVALSAEPVAGWGRHLPWIRELRARLPGKMLVLVPEKLSTLRALQNICQVHNGCDSLCQLTAIIRAAVSSPREPVTPFALTPGQRTVLARLSSQGRDKPLNLSPRENWMYWHHARLAENVGVRDFRMLLMTGLDREVCRMENPE